jgi:parallel beta-helix repeat protein
VEVIKMGDKDIWKILAIPVVLAIFASSVAIFSTANFGIGEERIEESGGKGIISLVPPPFIGVAGASGSYVAATNLDTGESFSSIQAAIDDIDTKGGHTITVNPGFYIENVNVHKALTIKSVGGNPNDTVIIAVDPGDHVIEITANNVNIIGLRTQGSATLPCAGIHLFNVSHCYIANCFATMNCNGIVMESSSDNRLYNNTAILNSGFGIGLLLSNNNIIEHNVARDNEMLGISLLDSEDNLILNNNGCNNKQNGIYLGYSNNSEIVNNTVMENDMHGISLYASKNNIIQNNTAARNTCDGIELLLNSERNVVVNNLVLNNSGDGIHVYSANGNRIISNNASYNKKNGIFVHSSTCEIRRNVANSNFYKGIDAYNSDESIIEENICENNIDAKPDLVIKHVFGNGHYPGNIPVDIRIENRGLRNAEPPFTVEVVAKYKRQLDVWYETKRVDVRNVLSPGKYVDVSTILKKHGLDWDGTFPITVHVDCWNSVVESNEDNNIYHGMGRIIRS